MATKPPIDPGEIAAQTLPTNGGRAIIEAKAIEAKAQYETIAPVVPPPIVSVEPPAEMVEIDVQDEGGFWTRKAVTRAEADEAAGLAKLSYEELDRYVADPYGLGADWDNGRGELYHARWANTNPKWRRDETKFKYAPVKPDSVPASLRNRFNVSTKIPGFEGIPVLWDGQDLVLMECPKRMFEERTERQENKYRQQLAEMEGIDVGVGEARLFSNVGSGPSHDIGSPGDRDFPSLVEQMAQADAEAQMMAGRDTRSGSTFGGFQGNRKYNHTAWGSRGN